MFELVAQFGSRFWNSQIVRCIYNVQEPDILHEVTNQNTGISCGGLVLGDKYFFKNIPQKVIRRERSGHRVVSLHYPTANLVKTIYRINTGKLESLLLYEYIDELDKPGMMLADILDTPGNDDTINTICKLYRDAFLNTYKISHATAHNIFFKDRVALRIVPWYTSDLIDKWQGKTVLVNGEVVTLNIKEMTDSIKSYFSENHPKEPTVITQGDTTEWNISTKPLVLDYEAGGRVPLMAEAAVAHVMFTFYGDYLARKYNPAFFLRRGLYVSNGPTRGVKGYKRKISPHREKFIARFTSEVLAPVVAKTGLTTEMKDAYRHYYLMKMLAVFSPEVIDDYDFLYILAKAQQVFDKTMDAADMNDLMEVTLS